MVLRGIVIGHPQLGPHLIGGVRGIGEVGVIGHLRMMSVVEMHG